MPRQYLSVIARDHPHLAEIASQYSRMVEIAIMRGDKIRAYECVDSAFRKLESQPDQFVPTEATELDAVLGDRIASILARSGIETVGQLQRLNEDELLHCRNVSNRTARQIIARLAKFGFRLAGFSEESAFGEG